MQAKNRSVFVSGVLAATLILVSCGARSSAGSDALLTEPTEGLPARFKALQPVAKPDFSVAAQDPAFQQAIKDATEMLGAQPQPFHSQAENEEVVGGVSFDVPSKKVE